MSNLYKFLNVGFGDTAVLYLDGKVVMVDCYESHDYGDRIVEHIPRGVIDYLILTHRHYDHYFGIEKLLENSIEVREIWESPWERKDGDKSIDADQWNKCQYYVDCLVSRGAIVKKAYSSPMPFISIGENDFYTLNPSSDINEDKSSELHDGCLVVMLKNKVKGKEILFCGDANFRVLDKVMRQHDIGDTRILCSSHHSALDSVHEEFLIKVSPEYTIISSQPGITPGIEGTIPEEKAVKMYSGNTRKALLKTYIDGTLVL